MWFISYMGDFEDVIFRAEVPSGAEAAPPPVRVASVIGSGPGAPMSGASVVIGLEPVWLQRFRSVGRPFLL